MTGLYDYEVPWEGTDYYSCTQQLIKDLEDAGFKLTILPFRAHGCNQTKFRTIRREYTFPEQAALMKKYSQHKEEFEACRRKIWDVKYAQMQKEYDENKGCVNG